MNNALVWFRNDLRIQDNEALTKACTENNRVIAVYCFDPRHYYPTGYGFKKTGKYRTKFLIETIRELKENLKNLNISLLVFQDRPEKVIPKLTDRYELNTIYFQKEWTLEEKKVEKALLLKAGDIEYKSYYQQFLYHPEDIPFEQFSKIPEVFTHFRKSIEKNSRIRKLFHKPEKLSKNNLIDHNTEIPNLIDLGFHQYTTDPRSSFPFHGGEDEALKRVEQYFWSTSNIASYKETRNGLLGTEYSSKLSAWLANGSISAKQIYFQVKDYESEVVSNQSTYWLIFELIWRDFFKYISLKHGNKIFLLGGILDRDLEWHQDKEIVKKWIAGETSEDFINANMKEIASTGFMSNRGRQNVNSYWAKELKQDWRIGAVYFESILIDYDVHSNWGNWMYNSGVGNDPRDRKFNIKKQAERYDPDSQYRDLWLKN